ncbi:MAG: 2-amino-4-hydroxy-6-hydroxymethyldihydropteridine diphosphokinase [Candidatus Aminicenantes bacterium]|nr:2-amino-4-hydroxy-6-hydroxymethyldihydropteridine diphosphokinase [Candidatus Aminicenantes bacterium]
MMKKNYYLSLGSNIGDKIFNLQQALNVLKETGNIVSVSSVYRTSPVDMDEDADYFLNLALVVESALNPDEMLHRIKGFECRMGRSDSGAGHFSRIIDIDILQVDHMVICQADLFIPHPKMTERAFVLVPLNEIAPQLLHPVLKKKVADILSELQSKESVEKYSGKLMV